jgi:serine/threonine protein kinase
LLHHDAMAIATDTISYFSTQSMSGANVRPVPQGDRLVGRLVGGKYRLIERIGRGAYGSVYRAEQLALGRDVAVKILRPGVSDEAAFFAEAWGASRVHHPNVVTIFDYGESSDRLLFLVMEHVAGVTLSEIIDEQSPLPVPRVLSLMLQLAQGLEAVHRAGIVHADLKSSNIMISPLPHGELVKLVDFGIARRIDASPASPLATSAQPRPVQNAAPWSVAAAPALASPGSEPYIFGTPGYMAPEVIRGIAPSFTADVYAAGVVLYRLLTGMRPFAGETPDEIFHQQLHSEPIPPSMLRAHAPLALERIALRALAREPEDRFANGTALRRALEAVAVALVSGLSPSETFDLDEQDDEQPGSVSRNRIGTEPGSEQVEEDAVALEQTECA